MLSKLVAWAVNTPLHDVQRELIREQTRRLRIKTDLQEERIQKRKKREENRKEADERFHHRATLGIKFRNGDKPCTVYVDMLQSNLQRKLHFNHVAVKQDDGYWKKYDVNNEFSSLKTFALRTSAYREIAETWLNGTINLEEAKALADIHGTDHCSFRVLKDLINKNKKG